MGSGFFPGMVVGLILGVLATMIGLAIFAKASTPNTKERERDPADWWKDGGEPPC
jgi:hypothetical protein